MIGIISHSGDVHAAHVQRELDRLGAPSELVDLATFPVRARLSVRPTTEAPRARLHRLDRKPADLDAWRAVWWRRPQPITLDPALTDNDHRTFAWTECSEALAGTWGLLDAYWMNDPTRDAVAHRKIVQLRAAVDVGLDVPDTLVTSDPEDAAAFLDSHGPGRVVCKSFAATETSWRETRLVGPAERAQLDMLPQCPVIFQEYVPAVYDLRVTVVGDEVFAAAIHSQQTDYPVDCRMDLERARFEAIDLPSEVEARLHAVMRRFGLQYGAIDLRLHEDGRYVFLEVNPAGQWHWVEARTSQPITAAVARKLWDMDRARAGGA